TRVNAQRAAMRGRMKRRRLRNLRRRDQALNRVHDGQAQAGIVAVAFVGAWFVNPVAAPAGSLAGAHEPRHVLLVVAAASLTLAMLCFIGALAPRAGLARLAVRWVFRRGTEPLELHDHPFAGVGVSAEAVVVAASSAPVKLIALANDFKRVRRIKLAKHLLVLAGWVGTAAGFGATVGGTVLR